MLIETPELAKKFGRPMGGGCGSCPVRMCAACPLRPRVLVSESRVLNFNPKEFTILAKAPIDSIPFNPRREAEKPVYSGGYISSGSPEKTCSQCGKKSDACDCQRIPQAA